MRRKKRTESVVPIQGNRCLVLSYFANDNGMACSHHIDDKLAILKDSCVDLAVLSSSCVPRSKQYKHRRVPSLSPSGLRFELRHFLRSKRKQSKMWKNFCNLILLPVLPLYALERAVLKIDNTWYWFPLALLKAFVLCKWYRINFLYSTGGPPVAHLVAGCLKRLCRVSWIAEFQDPLVHDYCASHQAELNLLSWAERYIYQRADKVVFLTASAMKETEKRVGSNGKGEVIYPGANPYICKEFYSKGEHLVISHFGSLGGVRNLEMFLRALSLASEERPELADILRVDLFGNVGNDDLERISRSQLSEIIFIKGLLPRHKAIERMCKTDVLLLIQGVHDISKETIPSKAYEYLQVFRPILGLIHENLELGKMLESLGHFPVGAGDAEATKNCILELIDQWKKSQLNISVKKSPYTVEKAVDLLVDLVSEGKSEQL